jgi:hypothetical protein
MLARSSSRSGATVRVLAVHDTEGSGTAEFLRDARWWAGSSHAIADEHGTLLTPAEGCVPYERASWTLRSGNPWSENIELVGFAKWTRADWLARPKLLDRCAFWLAERSKARGIPLVKLTPRQYRAGQSGVIGHHDHTVGYSDGTHWDPGPGFPWDVVLDKARAYAAGNTSEEDDMTPDQARVLTETRNAVQALIGVAERPLQVEARLTTRIAALQALVQQLAESHGTPIDLDAIEAVVEKGVADAIAAIETTVRVETGARTPGTA